MAQGQLRSDCGSLQLSLQNSKVSSAWKVTHFCFNPSRPSELCELKTIQTSWSFKKVLSKSIFYYQVY